MRRTPALPPCRRADGGFTLVEMLVVLAITGLIAGLLYPQIAAAGFTVRQRLAREQVAAGVDAARAMALRSGAAVALGTDRDGTALVIGGVRRIAPDPAGLIRLAMRPQTIVFHPDGSTTGGQLVLGTGRGATTFEVSVAGGHLRAATTAGSGG